MLLQFSPLPLLLRKHNKTQTHTHSDCFQEVQSLSVSPTPHSCWHSDCSSTDAHAHTHVLLLSVCEWSLPKPPPPIPGFLPSNRPRPLLCSALLQPQLTDHGGSPGQGGLGALAEVIHGGGSAVRHLEVGVDVDAAGYQHLPVGINSLHTPGDDEVVPDLPVGSDQQSSRMSEHQTTIPAEHQFIRSSVHQTIRTKSDPDLSTHRCQVGSLEPERGVCVHCDFTEGQFPRTMCSVRVDRE